jgi:hypothetical protein
LVDWLKGTFLVFEQEVRFGEVEDHFFELAYQVLAQVAVILIGNGKRLLAYKYIFKSDVVVFVLEG